MSVDSIRNEVNRIKGQIAAIEKSQITARKKLHQKRSEANRIRSSIKPTMSQSMIDSKMRSLDSKNKEGDREEDRVAGYSKDIQRREKQLESALRRLQSAETESQRKRDRETAKERSAEKKHLLETRREQERLDRLERVRRQAELNHERALTREVQSRDQLFSRAISLETLSHLPERITVLFVLADPNDQHRRDLGNEVRDVTQRIERATHRDSVSLEQVTAAQPRDLLPALNKFEPRILHFSGHGSGTDGLVFRDHDGSTKIVSADALAATIATVADSVRLVVLNACESQAHAELLVEHIDAAIGMSDSIGDLAAGVFSAALYGAIADGRSLARSFDQACAALQLEGIGDFDIPHLFARDGLDLDQMVLVRPPEVEGAGTT